MSEPSTIICPECHTAQREDAPFCDNCGYRLGRLDTAQEGHAAIPRTPHVNLADTERERPAVDLTEPPPALEESRSSVPTAVEGVDAVTPEQVARHRSDSTEVEGVSSLSTATEAGLVPSPATEPGREPVRPTADASGIHPSPGARRFVPLIAFWAASLVAAVMITTYYVRNAEPDVDPKAAAVVPSKLSVPAGPFEKGLDDSVRSFILMSCLKVSDDSDDCEQDELLAGEFPEETVTVDAFEIDATEVTVAQWNACVTKGDCPEVDTRSCKVYTHQGLQMSLRVPKSLQAPEVAVTCVNRAEAAAYCDHAGGRLPRNDEWERAARGTDGRLFPWGMNWDPAAANWGEVDIVRMPVVGKIDGFERVAPPGQFPDGTSPAGAYDMAGNVSEWVSGEDPDAAIARGGSWTSTPFDLRTTGRLDVDATVRRTDVGFRCAY